MGTFVVLGLFAAFLLSAGIGVWADNPLFIHPKFQYPFMRFLLSWTFLWSAIIFIGVGLKTLLVESKVVKKQDATH